MRQLCGWMVAWMFILFWSMAMCCNRNDYHIVREGECLWKIAQMHGVSVESLCALNNLSKDSIIHPGDKLFIRKPSMQSAKTHVSRKPNQSTHQATPNSKQLDLAITAQRYIGVRYRYASSLPSRGFDCSGFVYYLLQRYGVTVPRTASAMFKIGKPVKRSELRAGDLVFFKTTSRKRITHVGIYIGDGKFVHASSAKGRVTVSSLVTGYYANRYVGARRIFE
ncbi:MAG: hypothetical protein RUDDFDWM_001607 [Candidatus Fervidibacterota bacterium]